MNRTQRRAYKYNKRVAINYRSEEGEVNTPLDVVNEMLDKYPDEVWISPTKRFVIIEEREGTITREVVKRLLDNGHSASSIKNRVVIITNNTRFYNSLKDCWPCTFKKGDFLEMSKEERRKLEKGAVVITNPPYQLSDGGHGRSSTALYNKFIEKILEGEPAHLVAIMPARWHTGGKGLDDFRKNVLNNDSISEMTVYRNSKDCFPNNDIKGGICHFHYDANYSGDCDVTIVQSGKKSRSTTTRKLNQHFEHCGMFLSEPKEVAIVDKVQKIDKNFMDQEVSSRKPFGLATNYKSTQKVSSPSRPIKFYQTKSEGYISKNELKRNHNWIGDWKVLMPKASDGMSGEDLSILGQPIVAPPNSACSETYLVVGRFDNKQEADNLATYINTKFFRFMVSIIKKTQDATRKRYSFVPQLSMTKVWTDKLLYARYNLTKDEIDFIEKRIKKR